MQPVILSKREQEYLLRIIEGAHQVRDLAQLFLLAQGQLQALLPHRQLVCLRFGPQEALLRLECLHAEVLDDAARQRALRLARGREAVADDSLCASTGELPGGATAFVLFGMPLRANARHAYFFDLLLPYLHLVLLRLADARANAAHTGRPLSAREREVLQWLRAGKSNHERLPASQSADGQEPFAAHVPCPRREQAHPGRHGLIRIPRNNSCRELSRRGSLAR